MKLQELYEDLQNKEGYKSFMINHPQSFLCAGFFIFDFDKNTKSMQLDFFTPDKKIISSFEHPFSEVKIYEDKVESMIKLDTKIKIDIDDLKAACEEIILKNNSTMRVSKIIAILNNSEWNITCMDNFLGIIRIRLDAKSGESTFFTKGSIMDIAKQIKKK